MNTDFCGLMFIRAGTSVSFLAYIANPPSTWITCPVM